jgi:hypothetical protein
MCLKGSETCELASDSSSELTQLREMVEGWRHEAARLQSGMRAIGNRVEALAESNVSDDDRALLTEIKLIQRDVSVIKMESLPRIENLVKEQGVAVQRNMETIAANDRRLTVIESFCNKQVEPALRQIYDNRVDIAVTVAKVAAAGVGGGGGITLVILLLGKAWGWF